MKEKKKWTKIDEFMRYHRYKNIINEIKPGSIIADYATESGKFLHTVKDKIAMGYGYDKNIQERKEDNLIFKKLDLVKSRPDLKFDYICLIGFVEHLLLPDCYDLFFNIKKNLKEGGKLLITTPSLYSKPILDIMGTLKIVDCGVFDHKNYFTKNRLKEVLANTGFNIIKIKYFEFGLNIYCCCELEKLEKGANMEMNLIQKEKTDEETYKQAKYEYKKNPLFFMDPNEWKKKRLKQLKKEGKIWSK